MALILEFSAHTSKSCRRATSINATGSAEIVIFPGVRYERWDDSGAARGKRRGKARDRIELPD